MARGATPDWRRGLSADQLEAIDRFEADFNAIDRHYKRVFHDGGPTRYDELVIATGSSAFVPPFEGLTVAGGGPKSGVCVFRTLEDCEKITELARRSRRNCSRSSASFISRQR